MKGFSINIEEATLENGYFRKVLYTSKHSQLVLMSLKPREEIGMEVHEENDQFFRFEKGQGRLLLMATNMKSKTALRQWFQPAQHNIINISDTEDLKLYTIYSPAHHKDEVVRLRRKKPQPMKLNSTE